MAIDNALFDNTERGLSLEHADGAIVRGNRLVGNVVSQLQALESRYSADDNCYDAPPGGLVADFTPFGWDDRFEHLAAYQQSQHQDPASREGGCGALPPKVDVQRLTRTPSAR
jgi:hypothetical protein